MVHGNFSLVIYDISFGIFVIFAHEGPVIVIFKICHFMKIRGLLEFSDK